MTRYSVQARDRMIVCKRLWIFVFPKNMGKNIGKSISKNINGKYSPGILAMR